MRMYFPKFHTFFFHKLKGFNEISRILFSLIPIN